MWDTSCPDWRERIEERRSLVPDLPLNAVEADKAERIFARLRIPDVPGAPTMREAGNDWQFPIVRAIFGALDTSNPVRPVRRIQEFFWLIAKKNSKSSGAGAIMLTALIVNRRPNAEGLFIAPTKKIADIAFGQAWNTIKADPELAKMFHGQVNIRRITNRRTGALMEIKAADTDAVTGGKATYTLIDETHEFAKKSRAAQVFLEVRGALTARPDGFLIQVTTQSKDPPAGVFKVELEMARRVRDGEMQLPLLPILYELPADLAANDGWADERTWGMVNPNLGQSVNVDFLRTELTKARQNGPEAMALLASQHFNVEVGLALRADRWPGADHWLKRALPLTLAELLTRSVVVTIGLDGGGLDDLLGLAVCGREPDGRWLLWCRAWLHRSALTLRKQNEPTLLGFVEDGDLVVTDSMERAFRQVADLIEEVAETDKLAKVGLDPAGVADLVAEIEKRGVTQEAGHLEGVSQGYKLTGTVKTAGNRLADGHLWHADQRMMNWVVGNAKVEPKGNAIIVTKQVSGTGKIDPLMAGFNAVALMATNPEPIRVNSVYNDDDHDMLIL